MGRGVNKVIVVGNLGQDPEMRYTQSGTAVATMSVATTESWNDKETGNKQEQTEWHRIVCFGKLGEICGEYLRKGSQAYFSGQLRTRKWQDQQGQDRYTTEIVCKEMQMLGARSDSQGDGMQQQAQGRPQGQSQGQQGRPQAPAGISTPAPATTMDDFEDDDIPF